MSPRYVTLVQSFHALAHLPVFETVRDVQAVDLRKLDAMCLHADPDGSDGVRDTAAFVLNLWSTYEKWACGKFCVFHALTVWDSKHTAAFQRWAANPWRP